MNITEINKVLALPLEEILAIAGRIRRENIGNHIETCGIVNAKSGKCSEDCKFCAQSAHHCTNIPEYSLKSKDTIIKAARAVKKNGSEHFGIVTSGNKLTHDEVGVIAEAIEVIKTDIGISPCASLGTLDSESFAALKSAGLIRYHHNIETSERFYPQIVSTHDYSERVATIKIAKSMGFEVCSGGIIGMGETWQDRIDMVLLLKELAVDSVPLNFLVPINGTPMENVTPISPSEAIRSIALFRIILKDVTIKVAAGREAVLKDSQSMIYSAGANGMMMGGYLTVPGRSLDEDKALVSEIQTLWNAE